MSKPDHSQNPTTAVATRKAQRATQDKTLDRAWPHGKARKARFSSLLEQAGGDLVEATGLLKQSPEARQQAAIEASLQQLHLRPEFAAGGTLSEFVFLMRELVADFVPGMTLPGMLEPLRTLLSNHGGGRPTAQLKEDEFLALFEAAKRANRTGKTAREMYEDICAAENEKRAGSKLEPIKWTRVRDGVSSARARLKNRV